MGKRFGIALIFAATVLVACVRHVRMAQAAGNAPAGTGRVVVRLLVPQKANCRDSFMIYPYPVKPPSNDVAIGKLPKTMKELRSALLSSGYSGRVTPDKAYPSLGWRWRYIYETAVAKSKQPVPHSVLTAYSWVDDMVPYVIPEMRKVNMAERIRSKRYKRTLEFWQLNGVDLENAATQGGVLPRDISFDSKWTAYARLPEGNWWVVGVHRVAGIVFYWQEPVKVSAAEPAAVNLDEWNALVVQGDW